MYGQITKFRPEIGTGVIRAEDGRKYRFVCSELMNRGRELVGQGVDFVLVERRPREIIVLSGSPWTAFGANPRRPN
jgi:cold shock CspA family protein